MRLWGFVRGVVVGLHKFCMVMVMVMVIDIR